MSIFRGVITFTADVVHMVDVVQVGADGRVMGLSVAIDPARSRGVVRAVYQAELTARRAGLLQAELTGRRAGLPQAELTGRRVGLPQAEIRKYSVVSRTMPTEAMLGRQSPVRTEMPLPGMLPAARRGPRPSADVAAS